MHEYFKLSVEIEVVEIEASVIADKQILVTCIVKAESTLWRIYVSQICYIYANDDC